MEISVIYCPETGLGHCFAHYFNYSSLKLISIVIDFGFRIADCGINVLLYSEIRNPQSEMVNLANSYKAKKTIFARNDDHRPPLFVFKGDCFSVISSP